MTTNPKSSLERLEGVTVEPHRNDYGEVYWIHFESKHFWAYIKTTASEIVVSNNGKHVDYPEQDQIYVDWGCLDELIALLQEVRMQRDKQTEYPNEAALDEHNQKGAE